MTRDDPGYENRLLGLGSEALVKAMRYGDWDIIEGAFFDCWNKARHVIRPFEVPATWMRFRSMDWGSARPFSVGWWAVTSDPHEVTNTLGDKLIIPRGCMVRYREWCGSSKPNVGLKLHAEVVADGIVSRETKGEVSYGVLDPAAFAEDGGKFAMRRGRVVAKGYVRVHAAGSVRDGRSSPLTPGLSVQPAAAAVGTRRPHHTNAPEIETARRRQPPSG